MKDVAALVLLGGLTAATFYGCVLYDRSLRMQQQSMYVNAMVQMAQAYVMMQHRKPPVRP